MARLIDVADLSCSIFAAKCSLVKGESEWVNGYRDALASVLELIEEAHTVDAVKVHGHWYKAPHHPYRCSNCGEEALLDMYGESHYRSNYCPNCGAKMDGDEK